ncbi:hypothetical protein N5853_13600 (plasmid) [Bartonella sp. HY329]|uniref:alginate O-acetyltransferase AlgX-related protein n=1 Tax=unclassified Bartonella TaxID=2645622 RepID=UPI0021C7377B|nr:MULTISPECIES: hypothetical protein [unclassified Bartonella]UXM96568.1 hypothetical protein N5853_13600 [Bartonella sp. HY329]UXN10891.1 hypothetical protein N5852_13605 [Bartonella sp. HY328]
MTGINNMKNLISCVFLLTLFFIPLLLFFKPASDLLVDEKREPTAFPKHFKITNSHAIKDYFSEIDKFVSDNFPSRSEFIGFNRGITLYFHDNIDARKAFRGQENWLFLGNDYNQTIDKLTGNKPINSQIVDNRSKALEAYVNIFAEHGIKTIFLVGPNKYSIYPEKLPSFLKPTSQRYITPIIRQMQNDGIDVYDPTRDLINYKHAGLLYYRTDTHWNLKAGELVALNLLKKWHLNAPPAYSLEAIKARNGDLVSIASLTSITLVDDDNYSVKYRSPSPHAKLIKEDGTETQFDLDTIATTDNNIIINPDATNQVNLWIVGDSFTGSIQPFLAGAISHIEMMHIQKNTASDIAQRLANAKEKPQYALIVLVERGI